jgi:hypothetical protein
MTNAMRTFALLRSAPIFAIPALILACNGDDGLVRVRPRIATEPPAGTELVFGEVVLERTSVEPIVIVVRNVGEGPLSIEAVRIEGDGAPQFRISSHPKSLVPGQVGEIFLRFEPSAVGVHNATLFIDSNDTGNPTVSFPITGPAREPCSISATPGHQSFLLGEIRTVTVRAESSYECSIVRIFMDENLFDLVDGPELPYTIPAGGTLDLQVQHVGITNLPGIPTREMRIKESEGTEAVVSFEGEPPVYGCLSVFPSDRILFGAAQVGTTLQARAVVRNSCNRDAAVSNARIGTGFYYYSVQGEFPQTVPPLGTIDVVVVYQPFAPEGDRGVLNISTNDAANPRFAIELYGTAQVPMIQSFPQVLDFGTVVYRNPQGTEMRSECASRTQYIQIFSTGDAPLVLDSLEIEAGHDDLFQVTGVAVEGQPIADIDQPITVDPGEEARVTVQFYPTRLTPVDHLSKLLVHHNASTEPHVVTLVGKAANDGATTDIFYQLEGPKLDILWIIDDSCSMFDEQARLIENLTQFVGYADSQNADYQMAVTNTDSRSRNAGKLRRCFPHPTIVGSDYADTETREEAFECMFDIGTTGGGSFEAGLGAAFAVLERAVDPDNQDPTMNANAALLRDDAKLAIVVMSDEDDQSEQALPVMRDFYFSVKGAHRPDRVSVHAIAGPVDHDCANGPRQASPGYSYLWMTGETGGIFFDICEADWQPVLQDLGLSVFTPVDEWDLSQAADPASLSVTVDGVPVARDLLNGFSYNPLGNSIKFNGASVPEPGAEIVIDYTGLCRP